MAARFCLTPSPLRSEKKTVKSQCFNSNLDKLPTSPLLKPDQNSMLSICTFCQLWFIYCAYCQISKVTDDINVLIRRTVKAIIGLPLRANDQIFYSPRKLRGLGLFGGSCEVFLQHLSLLSKGLN